MPVHPSRRLLLGGLAAAALARPPAALAQKAARSTAQPTAQPTAQAAAQAAARPIAVGCWSGLYAEALHAAVDVPLQHNGAAPVRQVASGEQARAAALAAGNQDHLDVALLSDLDAYRLSLRQMFLPVTTDGVSSLPRVLPGLRVPYGVPQSQTALCIGYNSAKLREPPRSFEALIKAARSGRAGFSSELAVHNLAAAALSEGGRPSLEAAKTVFAALKRDRMLRIYPTNEALGEALASGEIVMAPIWRSRAYAWQQQGRDISDSYPSEGAVPFTILACVPRTSPQAQPALRYLETLLHPEAQAAMAKRTGLLPTVQSVPLDARLLRRIGFTASQRARFRPISLAAAAQNGIALREFWNRELA